MSALAVAQGLTPCPPDVMVLARELSEALEVAREATIETMPEVNQRFLAAYEALYAAGWCLTGPTDNVPGGALSWVPMRAG